MLTKLLSYQQFPVKKNLIITNENFNYEHHKESLKQSYNNFLHGSKVWNYFQKMGFAFLIVINNLQKNGKK